MFAHDVLFLYPLQFNWFSVFHACRFHHSAKPFLFRSQFLVSSSPEPADPDESLSVFSPKDHVFFFTDHCFRESVVRQWSLTLSSSFFSLKSHYFSSSFSTFQRKSREFSSILSLLAFRKRPFWRLARVPPSWAEIADYPSARSFDFSI